MRNSKLIALLFNPLTCLLTLLGEKQSNLVRGELYKPPAIISCSQTKSCPIEWPCCSPYGECGAGPICLGSCNPRFSFNRDSCAPLPALVPDSVLEYIPRAPEGSETGPAELLFLARGITDFTKYLVTPDKAEAEKLLKEINFTSSGPVRLDNTTGDLVLTMPKRSTGSLIASTKSFLYGKSFVRLKSGRSRGVITSIVLISSIGDEIDFEFLGSELDGVQTNYFFRGELVYTHMEYVEVSSSTWSEYHEYGFDWNEERIHWLVDGEIVRTLDKEDTWDPVSGVFRYPETPMRLEVALWPGGSASNHPGTIEWAGGPIDWDNSTDIVESGQFTSKVNYMRAEPYQNSYTPSMSSCLSQGKGITYDYISRSDASLEWYCNLIPYISGWTRSGADIIRVPAPIIREVNVLSSPWNALIERSSPMVPVSLDKDFIQDDRRLHYSQNNTVFYNTTRNDTVTVTAESSATRKLLENTPFYRLNTLLHLISPRLYNWG